MQAAAHPTYHKQAQITCNSCKTVYLIGSTQDAMQVEVCANCHPFYTGKTGQLVDTENVIKNYMKRLDSANKEIVTRKREKVQQRKSSRVQELKPEAKLTLNDMLKQTKK